MKHVSGLACAVLALSVLACNLTSLTQRTATENNPSTAAPPAENTLPVAAVVVTPAVHASAPPPAAGRLNLALTVENPQEAALAGEAVTAGVPLPRPLDLRNPAALRLVDAAGQPIPAQFTPLARWGAAPQDAAAPIRWLLLDFQVDLPPHGSQTVYLQEGENPPPARAVTLSHTDAGVQVDTGAAVFTVRSDGGLDAPGLSAPIYARARSGQGKTWSTLGQAEVKVSLAGSLRAAVEVRGSYREADGKTWLDYTSRYWFYAGRSSVRLFHTVENNTPCPLVEEAQLNCYDIGSPGSVSFDDLSLILPFAPGGELTFQAGGEGGPASARLDDALTIYQDSSGSPAWDKYPTLKDWDGNPLDARPRMQSYVSFRGYRTTLGAQTLDSGNRAPGWLSVNGAASAWAAGVRDFWQNFPKALRATPQGTIEIGLFPAEYGPKEYRFNLRAGEHKTHELVLDPNPQQPPLLQTLFARAAPDWYANSGAFGFLTLPEPAAWPDYEHFITYQLDKSPEKTDDWNFVFDSLPNAIEGSDFYGIYDYGDLPLDYEAYEVAPLNNKYNVDAGMWQQWARSADRRWFELAQAADRHYADLDILHNRHNPRHWGDGIAFGHSYHDEEGFKNPHRNYGGNHPDLAFGTPGLLLAYYLTGYDKAHTSALELADCIEFRVHNDDHLCDFFPDGECSGEGYALDDALDSAGARPAANSLMILAAAYRASGEPRYLKAADAIVNWARPEKQAYIHGPTGQDMAMKPWTLNLYLRSLAEYIEVRQEFGLADDYGARQIYLTYADWLHTYPWLELPPEEGQPRGAYPYEWWYDERSGIEGEDNDNRDPSINNWLLLGADAMAYAHRLSGEQKYLDWGAALFRTGSRDPFFVGDPLIYTETKQAINGIVFGQVFLTEWRQQ